MPRTFCSPRRVVHAVFAVVAVVAVAACGGGSDVEPPSPGGLEWERCLGNLRCAWLEVPADSGDPAAGTFRLRVVRRPADDQAGRIGSLLVNPGGPGFGGSFLVESAEYFFSEDLLARFDIVGWDPRGTGESEPAIDCIDQVDPWFAVDEPFTDTGITVLRDTAADFAERCATANTATLAHVSTTESARDMDRLRRALGEERISYFGFSYGSELGATWVTLFPDTVRAAVLDGAVDPRMPTAERELAQLVGFENELDRFLTRCAREPECAFHREGRAGAAFDELVDRLTAEPLPVREGRTPVNGRVALLAAASAMYGEFLWPQLEQALDQADLGDGSGLLALFDNYYRIRADGSYGNEIEAFIAISCLDDPAPSTADEVADRADGLLAAGPRLGRLFAHDYSCVDWPARNRDAVEIDGAGAPTVLVVGVTNDAATPLESTRGMARALADARLVIVDAGQHGAYGSNGCIDQTVDAYLIDLEVPEDERFCGYGT
jgi:pimeloyl-ACP methyl ester carboxylesterase